MPRSLKLFAALACLLSLAACAGARRTTTAKGPLTDNAANASTARLTTQMNSGDVVVYSLDSPQQTMDTAPAAPRVAGDAPPPLQGVPSNRDESVTIYPLDQAGLIGGPTNPDALPPPLSPGAGMPAAPAGAVEHNVLQPLPGEAAPLQAPPAAPTGRLLTGQNTPPPGGFAASDEPIAVTPGPQDSDLAAVMKQGGATDIASDDAATGGVTTGGTIIGRAADGSPLRVYFGFNSFALNADTDRVIENAADAQGRGSTPIQVEGHASTKTATADPVQRSIINLKVSMNRAIAVTQRLIRDGVPATSIQTTAFGDTRPSLPVADKSAEAASRRVEIYTGFAHEPAATVADSE